VFRQIVNEHSAGICLSAARPEIFLADIDKAVAEGIPVICVDSDVPRSKRVLYIGTDNFKAGRESLKQMAALVPRGSIAVVTISGQRNLDDRVAGVADALANFPALKLAKILDDQGDARSAFDQVSELLQKKEKVDGIICLEAVGGSGAAGAVTVQHGRQAADCGLRQRSGDPGLDRSRRNYRYGHAKALRYELLWAEVPRRPPPQRRASIQRLAHRPGAPHAHFRR